MDRRAFLLRGAAVLAAAPAGSALLAACTGGSRPVPADPAVPIDPDAPIERGGVLRIYEWKEYLASGVLRSFAHAYRDHDVRVEVESFFHTDEAVARLRQPDADFDIFFPTPDLVRPLAEEGLLRPLTHEALPHLSNLWPWFLGDGQPFYDSGQRYSVPYTVFSSGIGWREDLVRPADAPDAMDDPFAILWNPAYRGRLGVYDNYLEALSLALQREGVLDVRAADDDALQAAAAALTDAVETAGMRFTVDGAEDGLPEGEFVAHQSWSGDVLTAHRYALEEHERTAASALRFRAPDGSARVVGCDLLAVCARGRNPVLAHAFIDHLLHTEVALDNFAWNGYQPPVVGAGRAAFADPSFPWARAAPEGLLPALLEPDELAEGQWLVGFGPSIRARWLAQWKDVASAS